MLLAANGSSSTHKLKLAVHQYNTNPNLFLEFFYLLRFSRSDMHKIFFSGVRKKNNKKKKKNAPQKMKSSGNLLKRAQKKFERVSTTFFFASKTRCRTGKNSKSRTEVRDLTMTTTFLMESLQSRTSANLS